MEILDEGIVRLFRFLGIFLCEVDEVGAVGNDVSFLSYSSELERLEPPGKTYVMMHRSRCRVFFPPAGMSVNWLERGRLGMYLAASYLCSIQFARNASLCSSCNGGFSHLRWDLRKRAKALPLFLLPRVCVRTELRRRD